MRGSAESAGGALTAVSPADRVRPLRVDFELAGRIGAEGSRREFLAAAELVAELSGREHWTEHQALEAVESWWGRSPEDLEPVEWIVSAARADEVMGTARPRADKHSEDD